MKSVTLSLVVILTGWIGLSETQFPDIKSDLVKVGEALYGEIITATRLQFPPNFKDCGEKETKLHQVWLYTNYRALWEYRLEHHNYTLMEGGDVPDNPTQSGSVIFLNWQNSTVTLDCPCGSAGSVTWRMYGRGSAKFLQDMTQKEKSVRFKAPSPRFYYRTYSCESGDQKHFFNVFTRPLAITETPPLMFIEGVHSFDTPDILCDLPMYKDLKDKNKVNRFLYIQAPFRFYWQFPSRPAGEPQTHEQEAEDAKRRHELMLPPAENDRVDNLYWLLGAKNKGLKYVRQTAHPPTASGINDITIEDFILDIKKKHEIKTVVDVCNRPGDENRPARVVLSSELKLTTDRIAPKHAGIYMCIVEDRNGLSSAYWWDGDYPPHDPFRGYSHIRVRAIKWVFISLVFVFGFCGITALMILILPDNMDDFTYDAEEESPPPKAEGAPEEVDKSDPSHQSIKIASSAMSVHSNMGEGQAAPHPSKFGLKGSVSAKTANKQKRGK